MGFGAAGVVDHALLENVTPGQHHGQDHALSGADHAGGLSDAQHGARGPIAGAHGHGDLSGVGENDHHLRAHAIGGPDHTGTLPVGAHAVDGPEHSAPLVAGQIFRADGLGGVSAASDFASVNFSIGDGVNAIGAGLAVGARVPFAGVIDRWSLGAPKEAGSITLDVYRNTQAQLAVDSPAVGDSMVGAGTKPSLASAQANQATPPAGWSSTTVGAGDWLFVNVDSAAVLRLVTLELRLRKT